MFFIQNASTEILTLVYQARPTKAVVTWYVQLLARIYLPSMECHPLAVHPGRSSYSRKFT